MNIDYIFWWTSKYQFLKDIHIYIYIEPFPWIYNEYIIHFLAEVEHLKKMSPIHIRQFLSMSKWWNLLIIISKVQCSQYWPLIYTKYIINECCSTIGLIIGTIFYIICTYTYLHRYTLWIFKMTVIL